MRTLHHVPTRLLTAILLALQLSGCEALGFNRPVELPPTENRLTPGGVVWTELDPGVGDAAKIGDRVSVHYTARTDGGQIFDSSEERGIPIEVELGAGEVIAGWDEGMLGMRPSERRRLWIPPELAYGSEGLDDVVPPDTALILIVELIAIQ